MAGAWEIKEQNSVLCAILHTDNTTIAWAFGLRNLIIPGPPPLGLAGMPFDHARNLAAMRALEAGVDWCFYLDSDVIPPHDAILRLISHQQPIMSGLYCRRSPPAAVPVMIKNGQWVTEYKQGSIVEVDLVGAGCLAIHRSVLESLPPQSPGHHWFDWRVDMQGVRPAHECLSEDFTFCYPKYTWIFGERLKVIKNVVVGDLILDHRGELSKVLDTTSRLYSGDLISVKTWYMNEISSTPDHKYYMKTTSGDHWVPAIELKVGDYLAVPKIKYSPIAKVNLITGDYLNKNGLICENNNWRYLRTRHSALSLSTTLSLTPQFCRLLGYYIAEGFPHTKLQAINFAFNESCIEDINDCKQVLFNIFGARCLETIGGGCNKLTVSSKLLGMLFTSLCGKGAHYKHMPPFWYLLSDECLKHLIKGYWRGDGYYHKAFGMSTMSSRLARELQMVLLRLNILCGIRFASNKYGRINTLSVPTVLTRRFGEIVDYDVNSELVNSNERLIETGDYFFVKIRTVSKRNYHDRVYNLKIENSESYTANGVAVHNCNHARNHGYKILVDTSVQCRHIGYAQSSFARFEPLDAVPVT